MVFIECGAVDGCLEDVYEFALYGAGVSYDGAAHGVVVGLSVGWLIDVGDAGEFDGSVVE